MALKNLSTESMIFISSAWVDAKKDRPLFQSIPLATALFNAVLATHNDLVLAKTGSDTRVVDAAIAQNRIAADVTDTLHDRKARGGHFFLTGLSELADDPTDAQHFIDLRERIFPQGLSVTSLSYTDEGGNAEVARGRFDAATRAELKKLKTVKNRTLDEDLSVWLDAGARLGQLEKDHARYLAEKAGAAPSGGAPTTNEMVRARNAWIKVVNTLVMNLDLAGDKQTPAAKTLLEHLQVEETKADRRTAGRKAQGAATVPAPAALLNLEAAPLVEPPAEDVSASLPAVATPASSMKSGKGPKKPG